FFYPYLKQIWDNRHLLHYSIDGLIFARRCCSYAAFRSDPHSVIKYKDLSAITLDFIIENARTSYSLDLHKYSHIIKPEILCKYIGQDIRPNKDEELISLLMRDM